MTAMPVMTVLYSVFTVSITVLSTYRNDCTVQGQMSGDDLSAAYASGDVFMMPSESETLGFVALEAMASGLPVVAVAAGGLTDILTNPGVTGQPPLLPPCCRSTSVAPICTIFGACC